MTSDPTDGPARLHEGHARSRLLGAYAGAPRGFVNEHESTLDRYASKGLLATHSESHSDITSELRVTAGHAFRRLCERSRGSTRDSSQLVISGARSRGTISDNSAQAKDDLKRIEGRMGKNDAKLVRMVCDEGFWPSEAVRSIDPAYRDATVPRFREAMDALVIAFEAARMARA